MSQDQLDLAIRAAAAAGKVLCAGFGRPVDVLVEAGKDIKIRSDLEAESRILELLRRESTVPVLTEETGMHGTSGDGLMWVVDPLDGTLNYSRGLPLCCVSIALWRSREPILGVVYEFLHDRLYAGRVGEGAWCNGVPVRVSSVAETSRAVIATGFPVGTDLGDAALLSFVRRTQQFKKVRLLGSAALSLAHVASGAVDAYTENGIRFWDVAAGLALVRAAGGDFLPFPLEADWRANVVATNGRLIFN
jgi:myo-inositol-1(or 4)-monophosphatase